MSATEVQATPVLRENRMIRAQREMRHEAAQADLSLRRVHTLLRGRYLVAILLAILAAAGGAYLGYLSGAKVYSSSGLIRVAPVLPVVLYEIKDKGMLPMYETFVEAQVELIRSQRVVDMSLGDEAWRKIGINVLDLDFEKFTRDLQVSRRGEIIRIQKIDPDPQAAQVAVQTVINAYRRIYVEQDIKSGERRMEVLRDLQMRQSAEMEALRRRILAIANKHGTENIDALYDNKLKDLAVLESRIKDIEVAIAEALAVLEGATTRQLSPEEIARVDDSRQMQRLLDAKREVEGLLETQLGEYGENHPALQRTRRALALRERDIEQYVARFNELIASGAIRIGATYADPSLAVQTVDELREQLASIRAVHEAARQELIALGREGLQIADLRGELEIVRSRLEETRQRIEQLNVESNAALGTGRISIISDGDRPILHKDDRIRRAAAGGFGGIALGFGLVLLFGLLDPRLRTPEDAVSGMSFMPMLGILPNLPDDLSNPDDAAMAAHSVHQIRTLLQLGTGSGANQVFAITSPVSGTGKTSLTLALGVSFAAANYRTLLIDCDLVGGGLTARVNGIVRRKIGRILQREGLLTEQQLQEALQFAAGAKRPLGEILIDLGYLHPDDLAGALAVQAEQPVGVLDAVAGESLDECIAETGIAGLSILPVGLATAHHVSRLSVDSLRQVINDARKRFDIVVIDTGPVPGSLEASLVAVEVDGVVLTVSRGEQRPLAEKSVKHLMSVGARVSGIVFNRARREDLLLSATARGSSAMLYSGRNDPAGHVVVEPEQSVRLGPVARAVASFAPAPATGHSRGKWSRKSPSPTK
jgi:polysaccharide biosynthesis transport protein